jgi:hypothetical protein
VHGCWLQADKFTHLSNNSIQKHCADFDHTDIDGNMWLCGQFQDWIKEQTVRFLLWERDARAGVFRVGPATYVPFKLVGPCVG